MPSASAWRAGPATTCAWRKNTRKNRIDPSRQRYQRPAAAFYGVVEPGGGGDAPRVRGLKLPRDPHADPRGDAAFRARRGGRDGHRHEGDVHLRGPRREFADAAAGEYGVGDSRLYRASAGPAAGGAEALLHRADVPPRAAAEGALPAVLPDRGGGDRVGIAVRGRGSDRDGRRAFAIAWATGFQVVTELGGGRQMPAGVPGPAARGAGQGCAFDVHGLPAPRRDEPAAGARLQGARGPAHHRKATFDSRPPVLGLQRAFRRGAAVLE